MRFARDCPLSPAAADPGDDAGPARELKAHRGTDFSSTVTPAGPRFLGAMDRFAGEALERLFDVPGVRGTAPGQSLSSEENPS